MGKIAKHYLVKADASLLWTVPRETMLAYMEDPLWDDWPHDTPQPGFGDLVNPDEKEQWMTFLEDGKSQETFESYLKRTKSNK